MFQRPRSVLFSVIVGVFLALALGHSGEKGEDAELEPGLPLLNLASATLLISPLEKETPPQPFGDCPFWVPSSSNCEDATSTFQDAVEDAIDRYLNDDIVYCEQMGEEVTNSLAELWEHDRIPLGGGFIYGFYDDDRIGMTRYYESQAAKLAWLALHEGYHKWLGEGYEPPGEEDDADWWATHCTGVPKPH